MRRSIFHPRMNGKRTVLEAMRHEADLELSASELLYSTTDPYETPLVMPGWARSVAALAKQIDDGYALRRAAGLPTDGSFPGD